MMSPRPRILVFVTGCGTEIGKTWVGCELLRTARARGLEVAARKPAQSFAEGSDEPTDAALLGAVSGEPPSLVCPPERSYPRAMAPPMAAERLGLAVPALSDLAEAVTSSWPGAGCDLGLVEGAGGVASPLAVDGHSADLARALRADRGVVVADPALGVISSARLAVGALAPIPVVVHLNRFDSDDDLHRENLAWLRERDRFTVTTSAQELLGAVLAQGPGDRR